MSASTQLLPTALQSALEQVVRLSNQTNAQIRAITLSTTEGVPLGRVYASDAPELNEEALSLLETVWAPPSKQLPTLLTGSDAMTSEDSPTKIPQITAIYDHGALVHLFLAPILVATILCGPQSNLGALRTTAIPMLQKCLEPLQATLVESLVKPQDHHHQVPAGSSSMGEYQQ